VQVIKIVKKATKTLDGPKATKGPPLQASSSLATMAPLKSLAPLVSPVKITEVGKQNSLLPLAPFFSFFKKQALLRMCAVCGWTGGERNFKKKIFLIWMEYMSCPIGTHPFECTKPVDAG
jgi:hypothetical protein